MLRIHVEKMRESGGVTLRLEGKLVQPWAEELSRTWSDLAAQRLFSQPVRIDLNAVSFVDECGRGILTALHRAGCQLQASTPFIAAVIEECSTHPTDMTNPEPCEGNL